MTEHFIVFLQENIINVSRITTVSQTGKKHWHYRRPEMVKEQFISSDFAGKQREWPRINNMQSSVNQHTTGILV